jgi:carbon storage regulator
MLVLSRKPDESVWIDDDIEVVVISMSQGKVKLGFRAPLERRIVRAELRAPQEGTAPPATEG